MTEHLHDDDGDERQLRAVFDRSAEDASGALLTRMRARAADVPAHVRRRPRFVPRWAWAPAFAGVGVAGVTALAAAFSLNWGNTGAPAQAPAAAMKAVLPQAEAAPLAASPGTDSDRLDDEGLDDAPGEDWEAEARLGELDLDPLDGLAADDDLDAWLFATDELTRGGG